MTRERPPFGLLFRENVDYGFRRNLLGLRTWGVGSAVLALVISVALSDGSWGEILIGAGVPAISALAIGAFFTFAVTRSWVRVPAEAYAGRLFDALVVLDRARPRER